MFDAPISSDSLSTVTVKSEIKDQEDATKYRAPRAAFALSDFSILRNIGDGSYSSVVLAQRKGDVDQQLHAIKIVNKHLVSPSNGYRKWMSSELETNGGNA